MKKGCGKNIDGWHRCGNLEMGSEIVPLCEKCKDPVVSKEKFTQGEWVVDDNYSTMFNIKVVHDKYNETGVCEVDCSWVWDEHNEYQCEPTEEETANAHLIAATPNGFELGLLVMELCGHPSGISEQQADLLYETALSFIKKARGEHDT